MRSERRGRGRRVIEGNMIFHCAVHVDDEKGAQMKELRKTVKRLKFIRKEI